MIVELLNELRKITLEMHALFGERQSDDFTRADRERLADLVRRLNETNGRLSGYLREESNLC